MALIITPGAVDANAYADIAFFDEYHAGHVSGVAAIALTADVKERALRMTTILLDTRVPWTGEPTTVTQALAWPRTGMVYSNGVEVPSNIVPLRLKQANAEFARIAAATDPTVANAAVVQGIESLKAGPIEIAFREDAAIKTGVSIIPDSVLQLLVSSWWVVVVQKLAVLKMI